MHTPRSLVRGLVSVLWLATSAVSSPVRAAPPERPAGASKPEPAKGGEAGRGAEVLVIAGDVARPGPQRVEELRAMPAQTTTWTLHGQKHTVVGVPLEQVLARAGYDKGPMTKEMAPRDKRPGYKLAVVASAPDGFQAVFSAAELTAGMGTTQVLVIWQIDGKPLPPEQGPLRLVVPSDGEPSRGLYRLARLDVVDLRKQVPPLGR